MKFNLLISILLFTIGVGSALGQKQSSVSQVNLNITIDDSVSAVSGITSDGGGAYSNGVSGVTAAFLSTGVLEFKTGTRDLTATYSIPLDPLAPLPYSDTKAGSRMITIVRSGLYFQTMEIGSSRCERLVVSIPINSDYTRYIGYQAGKGSLTELAYVLVTRLDSNTWTMNSDDGACSANDNVARVNDAVNKGKAADVFHGSYFMPLKMTLTRKM